MSRSNCKRKIRLPLTSGHCMVCTAKARGRELAEKLLASTQNMTEEEEAEFELLQRFVLETDFEKLMKKEPLLDGRSGVTLTIEEGAFGKLHFHAEQTQTEAGPQMLSTIHDCEHHNKTE